jgi:large subunit ribosomal protein L2
MFISKDFLIKRAKKTLTFGFSKRAGKNCFGRKTIFTQSGGLRLFYNSLDLKRHTAGLFMLFSIERNYIYTGFLGLVCYSNGCFCYILLSENHNVVNILYIAFSGFLVKAPTFLLNIPAGNFIHHVEVVPGEGAKMMRAAGTTCFIISKENGFSFLKLKSGWLLKLSDYCVSILGKMSNEPHFVTRKPNAGYNRMLGFRPTVRGVAKNPCDHPHGGGEGTGSPPRAHKTPYGKLTKSPTTIKKYQKRNRVAFKIFKK